MNTGRSLKHATGFALTWVFCAAPAGKPFSWLGPVRITGGRTNVWGRACLRLSALDFKAASFDGYGEDWPLGYHDLEPYYDLIEEYAGVTGRSISDLLLFKQVPHRVQPSHSIACFQFSSQLTGQSAQRAVCLP
ncbi:MAG TPA: hypothetical protein VJV74_15190 [Terriglobia bacterium]|nr:hypothetical protein [Terriglobia bacterium]